MNKISPKMARALTVAIVRRANKYFPHVGAIGYYAFNGQDYHTKAELRAAVAEFCGGLSYAEVPVVQKNLGLV